MNLIWSLTQPVDITADELVCVHTGTTPEIIELLQSMRGHGVMVSTLDFEHSNPSSNLFFNCKPVARCIKHQAAAQCNPTSGELSSNLVQQLNPKLIKLLKCICDFPSYLLIYCVLDYYMSISV